MNEMQPLVFDEIMFTFLQKADNFDFLPVLFKTSLLCKDIF